MGDDSISSANNARNLIAMESSTALELYKDELIEAKKTINPNFKIENAANISVNRTKISLENCKINENVPIEVVIHNAGNEPLKIEKINVSCTCVSIEGKDRDIVVNGKGSYTAKFSFTPIDAGKVSRDIFIASNAFNNPNLHINILANVIPKNNHKP